MSYAEVWSIVSVIIVPVIAGIITWIWKLDSRLFDMQSKLLGRAEFMVEVHAMREELSSLYTELRKQH